MKFVVADLGQNSVKLISKYGCFECCHHNKKYVRHHLASAAIGFHLLELIADRQIETGQKLTLQELARETGVHRTTLSKMANQKGYVSSTEVVDKLCNYFGMPVEKLLTHVGDDQWSGEQLIKFGVSVRLP